jgi:dTDP-L-rhamnose 4-epimerase
VGPIKVALGTLAPQGAALNKTACRGDIRKDLRVVRLMTNEICIVTGGGGFIGCALSGELVKRFGRVVVLDKLHPQIHAVPVRPAALHSAVEFRRADITVSAEWDALLAVTRPRVIVHLAAETGTGQSLTEASRHAHENVLGTAVMLDALSRHNQVPEQIVLSSSRAIYGEGAWLRPGGLRFYPGQRAREQLARGEWDFPGSEPLPFAAADTEPRPTSVYGATKLAQEHVLESWALAYGAKLTICRLQNVYGPGQSLINSYTGILTLFARYAREGTSIPLYEDGLMRRDFIYIDDIADALLAAIDVAPSGTTRFDVGTGKTASISDVAEIIARRYGAPEPHVCGAYRHGDVRHASCDISATMRELSWTPQWPLERGLHSLCAWIDAQLEK